MIALLRIRKKEFIQLTPEQMVAKTEGTFDKFKKFFSKSDTQDSELVSVVKELTETVKGFGDRLDKFENQGIEKEAKDTGIPAYMLKAAEAEGPEAVAALKSNEALKAHFKEEARKAVAKGGDEVEVIEVAKGDHQAAYNELTKMAQAKMKKDKSLSFADAYDEAKLDRPDLAEAVV